MKRLHLLLLLTLTILTPISPTGRRLPENIVGEIATVASHKAQKPKWLAAAEKYIAPAEIPEEFEVETIFGTINVTEPVLIELLQHPVVQRMKEIDQHGPPTYFINRPTFSRYDHCLGVFALLRMHDRPLAEQVAGLLHDASHTTFCHVADHLFKTGNQHAYQDIIHNWYLQKMQVDQVLERYGLTIEEINPEQPAYTALEQNHPRLCADRIQYIINTGLMLSRLTQEDLRNILDSLSFQENNWVFSDKAAARKFADVSVYCTEHIWSAPTELAWRHWLCSALQQAIAFDLISSDDIHFGVDAEILERLNTSTDKHIKEMMTKCYDAQKYFSTVPTGASYDMLDMPKIRAVDPLIRREDEHVATPLTQLDSEYRTQVDELRSRLSGGVRIKLLVAEA
ncbi:MAG: uncharacterized protein QG632_159 [Candidatus Dependentiae bacterium]|nr:uncharacterized protein [Candidatus Dependentiae bacterium]